MKRLAIATALILSAMFATNAFAQSSGGSSSGATAESSSNHAAGGGSRNGDHGN